MISLKRERLIIFAIAIVGREITIEIAIKKSRTNNKNKEANQIQSDNFSRSNRGRKNFDIAILKDEKIISLFGCTNIISPTTV